jgi:excisionase family DNA binding protein
MDTGSNAFARLYTIDQVAEILAVSKITVYRLVESRKIPFYRIKGCIRFAETDVWEYIRQNRIGPVDNNI